MNAMTLHTSVAIPNFSIFETVAMDVPWRKELVRETLQFEDGHLLAPTAPGLGVELIEEACARASPTSPTTCADLRRLYQHTRRRDGCRNDAQGELTFCSPSLDLLARLPP
ncbi:MAG: hypothetical protein AcusKO_43880 [Acuticoccus sp.]